MASTTSITTSTTPAGGASEIEYMRYRAKKVTGRTWVVVEDDVPTRQYPFLYVVMGDDKCILIDTGTGKGDYRQFLSTCINTTLLPYLVICTHVHFDHTGGNYQFLPGDEELYPPSLGICMSGNKKAFSNNVEINSLALGHNTSVQPFEVSRWLNEGDLIYLDDAREDPNLALRVMITPGHTPDSLCLHAPFERRLFVGDMIYPFTVVHLDCLGSDVSAYQQSLTKISGLITGLSATIPQTPAPVPQPSPTKHIFGRDAFFTATGLDPNSAAISFNVDTLLEICDGSVEVAVDTYLNNPNEISMIAPPLETTYSHPANTTSASAASAASTTTPASTTPASTATPATATAGSSSTTASIATTPTHPTVEFLSCGHVESNLEATSALMEVSKLLELSISGHIPGQAEIGEASVAEYRLGNFSLMMAKYQLQQLRS
ncbi:metallo-beta-lactamase superfamily Hydrolase [Pelomyxa schiedti]|nr:metallo-beta-lactamase superfamily Hydrolase [Pelomyxa schiedti]